MGGQVDVSNYLYMYTVHYKLIGVYSTRYGIVSVLVLFKFEYFNIIFCCYGKYKLLPSCKVE